jgi:hypothetical protein
MKLLKFLPFLALPLLLTTPVAAQTLENIQVIKGFTDVFSLLDALKEFLLNLAPSLAVLVIMWGGYQYFLSSLGDAKQNGLKTIQAGIIGLIIVLSAKFIEPLLALTVTPEGIETDPLVAFLTNTTDALIPLASALAVLVIMWGGYQYFFSAFGDSKQNGLNTIKNGVIGLIAVLVASFIKDVIKAAISKESGIADLNAVPAALGKQLESLVLSTSSALSLLAAGVAVLVIIWGGYKYFQGGFDGKAQGLQAIQQGVIGLIVILLANFITGTVENLFKGINKDTDLALIPDQFRTILEPIITNGTDLLIGLASIVSVLVIVYGGYQFFFATLPNSKANGKETITKGVIGLIVAIIAKPIVTIVTSTIQASGPSSTDSYLQFENASIIFTIQSLISSILIPVSSLVTVFFFVLGGYYYITSNGSAEKVKQAKTAVTNALIGFVIVLLSITIVQLIVYFVKVEDLTQGDQQTNSIQRDSGNSSPSPTNNTTTSSPISQPFLDTTGASSANP